MRRQRLIILVLLLVGTIAIFLPWKEGFEISTSITGDGCLIFGLFLICFILTVAGNRNRSIRGSQFLLLLATSILIVIFCFFEMYEINVKNKIGSFFLNLIGFPTVGFGLYIILLVAITIPIIGISFRKTKSQRKGRHHNKPYKVQIN